MKPIGFALAIALLARTAWAGEPVDVALVMAVDVSLSVDDSRYALQQQGIAAAFEDPELAAAIAKGPERAVAVTLMQFSDPDRQIPVIGWTRIASAEDAQALARRIRAVRRSSSGLTGLADALLAARDLFTESPFPASHKVIDASGDGFSNIGTPIALARAAVLDAGITINGLPILSEEPSLGIYFQDYVIGGPDAFVEIATSLDSFGAAMKRKLLHELVISGLPPNRG